MIKLPLTLLVDPPMPGESMSSFLGRAAQFYCTPQRTLFLELSQGVKQSMRPDIDQWPTPHLLSVLEKAVPNWKSPQTDLQPFLNWVLAPSQRKAYCPACFVEDIAENRTPYFRQDWMAVLCTHCWKHESPLHQWQNTGWNGTRKLPESWIAQTDFTEATLPDFMKLDLIKNQETATELALPIVADSLTHYLVLLKRLQWIMEKPAASKKRNDWSVDEFSPFRNEVYGLIKFCTAHERRIHENGPIASLVRPICFGDWFGGEPAGIGCRDYDFATNSLRQAGDLSWRRSYLIFAMRTLAGSDFFHRTYFSDLPKCRPRQEWWEAEVRPVCLGPLADRYGSEFKSILKSDTCVVRGESDKFSGRP